MFFMIYVQQNTLLFLSQISQRSMQLQMIVQGMSQVKSLVVQLNVKNKLKSSVWDLGFLKIPNNFMRPLTLWHAFVWITEPLLVNYKAENEHKYYIKIFKWDQEAFKQSGKETSGKKLTFLHVNSLQVWCKVVKLVLIAFICWKEINNKWCGWLRMQLYNDITSDMRCFCIKYLWAYLYK